MRTFRKYNGSDYYEPESITNTLDFFDPDKNTKQELIEKFSKKVKNEVGLHTLIPSVSEWINITNAIGKDRKTRFTILSEIAKYQLGVLKEADAMKRYMQWQYKSRALEQKSKR